jgi:hypothetical protein
VARAKKEGSMNVAARKVSAGVLTVAIAVARRDAR